MNHNQHKLLEVNSITPATSLINCGQPPSPPTNGHILPYTNTLEGAEVMYVCWNIHQEANVSLCAEANTTAVCNMSMASGSLSHKIHALSFQVNELLSE